MYDVVGLKVVGTTLRKVIASAEGTVDPPACECATYKGTANISSPARYGHVCVCVWGRARARSCAGMCVRVCVCVRVHGDILYNVWYSPLSKVTSKCCCLL